MIDSGNEGSIINNASVAGLVGGAEYDRLFGREGSRRQPHCERRSTWRRPPGRGSVNAVALAISSSMHSHGDGQG